MPPLPVDATPEQAELLISVADADPRARVYAIKALASRGYALWIPHSWPERGRVSVHVDQQTFTLGDDYGTRFNPTPHPQLPEPLTGEPIPQTLQPGQELPARVAWGISAAAYWKAVGETPDAKIDRVRRENHRRRPVFTADATVARLPSADVQDGATIMLIPAAGDVVHRLVPDAHATVCFLGPAADLDAALLTRIGTEVAQFATTLRPTTIAVTGTATLGDDDARVLELAPAELTALRSALISEPATGEAVAAAEQFPSYRPHLTLRYGGKPLNPRGAPRRITFDRIALWTAEDHVEYQLGAVVPLAV